MSIYDRITGDDLIPADLPDDEAAALFSALIVHSADVRRVLRKAIQEAHSRGLEAGRRAAQVRERERLTDFMNAVTSKNHEGH